MDRKLWSSANIGLQGPNKPGLSAMHYTCIVIQLTHNILYHDTTYPQCTTTGVPVSSYLGLASRINLTKASGSG